MLNHHLDAGYPVVAVTAADESQPLAWLRRHRSKVFYYSATQEIRDASDQAIQTGAGWQEAIRFATEDAGRAVLLYDAQHIIAHPPIYRAILDNVGQLKQQGSAIVLVAPSWQLPPELAHAIPILDWPLPTRQELHESLRIVARASSIDLDGDCELLLDAAAGLTLEEAENAYALSVVETDRLDPAIVSREKMRLIAATGYLSVSQAAPIESVGGLGQLKRYVTDEVQASASDPQLRVRGILLVGVPGTGKSLLAKATGSVLQWPVLRLDVAGCKASLVGQSEANIRAATRLAEAVAPCVLWIDEIEKALGGYRSSAQTDGGTTLGLVGHLLTWLQEHGSPIVTVATCNDYSALPPELTRAGRFDERFFADLPTPSERVEIAKVHLQRLGCEDTAAPAIAEISDRWTGAEIEQLIRSTARRTKRRITAKALHEAATDIRPISQTRAAEIQALRDWARDTLRLANDAPEKSSNTRQVRTVQRTAKGAISCQET